MDLIIKEQIMRVSKMLFEKEQDNLDAVVSLHAKDCAFINGLIMQTSTKTA